MKYTVSIVYGCSYKLGFSHQNRSLAMTNLTCWRKRTILDKENCVENIDYTQCILIHYLKGWAEQRKEEERAFKTKYQKAWFKGQDKKHAFENGSE